MARAQTRDTLGVDPCLDQNIGRRRLFWSTIERSCGEYNVCGFDCAIPGLQYVDSPEGRTIRNDERLKSLALNILNTRARTDAKCPSPVAVYGHWSESYRSDNLWIGSRLWNAVDKSYFKTDDAVKAIGAAVKGDMMKLTALGVADDVQVETTYIGRSTVEIVISITVNRVKQVLNLSGTYATDTWIWR